MQQESTELTTGKPSGRLWGMGALLAGTMGVVALLAVGYLWMGAPAPPS